MIEDHLEVVSALKDVPLLRREIDRLRQQNELTHSAYVDENNRLMAEREALRKRVGELEAQVNPLSGQSILFNEAFKSAHSRAEQAEAQLAEAKAAQDQLVRYLPDIVKNAMLTMWCHICSDTGCHPLDLEHGKGKLLTFEPRHWAQMAGDMVATNARAALAQTSPAAAPVGEEG